MRRTSRAACSRERFAALELADEYGIKLWVAALLDPEPITHGTSDPKKQIQSPPAYRMKEALNGLGRSPEKLDGHRSTRGRSMCSASPTKSTPARKFATPRKSTRRGRNTLKAEEDALAIAEEAAESVNGDLAAAVSASEHVRIEVENITVPSPDGDEDMETTKVNVELPVGFPQLELPNNAEDMLATARKMVKEAEKISGPSQGKGKRKAVEMVEDEDDDTEVLPPKRVKQVQAELRKEKIKRRAITGIAAGLAFGYVPTPFENGLRNLLTKLQSLGSLPPPSLPVVGTGWPRYLTSFQHLVLLHCCFRDTNLFAFPFPSLFSMF